jgi:DNA-directed RNA polymerase specialized sigma24 family protein
MKVNTKLVDCYIRTAVYRHESNKKYRREIFEGIKKTLESLDETHPGILTRMENHLRNQSLTGTEEDRLLALAIRSMMDTRRTVANPTVSIGNRDLAPGDCAIHKASSNQSDPSRIAEVNELETHLQIKLEEAIKELPELQQGILRRVMNGEPQLDIAKDLGIPRATLNDLLQKTRQTLAVRLALHTHRRNRQTKR